MSGTKSQPRALVLSAGDNVATVLTGAKTGELISSGTGTIVCRDDVPPGHKIAIAVISRGDKIVKSGAPIGTATRDIALGEHVHVHNLGSDYTPARQVRI
jgi:hypothetical protein